MSGLISNRRMSYRHLDIGGKILQKAVVCVDRIGFSESQNRRPLTLFPVVLEDINGIGRSLGVVDP